MNFLLLFGVAVCAVAGALVAAPKKIDMFGVIVVAVVTALGGGTVRDVILGTKAFWVTEPVYVVIATAAGLFTFVAARFVRFSWSVMLVLDAFGLAMFAIVGCEKALSLGTSSVVIVLMGVVTGVAGGIVRDLLCDEIPLVFRRGSLYATAAFIGCLVFIALNALNAPEPTARLSGVITILVVRLAAMRWGIALPEFVVKEEN